MSVSASFPAPGRHLLVASSGGHLAQIMRWSERIGSAPDSLWVTFASPQSESLLRDRRVLYVPYVAPRDARATMHAFRRLWREVDWKSEEFAAAVTTGAAVGVAGLAAARLHRVASYYFESVSRVNGPSMTGRIAAVDPWVRTLCQYPSWANARWKFAGSLFDDFRSGPRPAVDSPRIFVTLGTIKPYRFDALIDAILATGLADDRTVWQLGETHRDGLPGSAFDRVAAEEFDRLARAADVVVTHAGVGTIMNLLEMGVCPVVVPRRAARGEHVDDHQAQIADLLSSRDLSVVREVEHIDRGALVEASARLVLSRSSA